jgi:hypothetical protein
MVILINCMVDVIPRVNRVAWMGIHIESAAWAHFLVADPIYKLWYKLGYSSTGISHMLAGIFIVAADPIIYSTRVHMPAGIQI